MGGHTRLTNKLKEKILEFLYKFKKIFLICININTTGRQGAHHCILSSTPQAASSHRVLSCHQLVIPLVRNDSFAAAGEWRPRHRQTFPALILESNLSVRTRDLIHKIFSDKCHFTKHLPLHLFAAVQVVQPVLQKSERKSAVSFFSTTNFNWLEITAGSVYFLLRLFLPVVNWAFVFCDRRRPSCRGIAGIWTPICRWIIAAEKCTAFALSPMLRSGIFSSGKAIQGSGGRFWDMGGRWAVTYLGSSGWIEKAKTATTDVLDFSWCILSFLFCTRPVSGSHPTLLPFLREALMKKKR